MTATEIVAASIAEHLQIARAFEEMTPTVAAIAQMWWESLSNQGQILFCGNGGSAADCQHLAAELTGRFETNRRPLRGLALTTDTSALTAIGNDFGYDQVFSRQVEALARPGDVLVAISTSGNSPSILAAATAARTLGASVVGFTGASGGKLALLCDLCLMVPAKRTARIQEMHILAGHCCCEWIDHQVALSDRNR